MSLRLIDLRRAALREYPEFGEVPPPAPWYCRAGWLLLWLAAVAVLTIELALVVSQLG